MIYYNNGWQFHTDRAFFNAHGQPSIKFTSDRDYWIRFVEKWWHHDSLRFEPITPTQAQIDRLAEVADVPESFQGDAAIYVECGAVSPDCVAPYLSTLKDTPETQSAWERYQLGPVPQIVSMRQARLALLGAGLLSQIETAIASLPEPAKSAVSIEWEYAIEVNRTWPWVIQLSQALGLTDEQLDQLFIAASKL